MNFVHYCYSAMDNQSIGNLLLSCIRESLEHSSIHLDFRLKYEHIYLTSFSKMRVDLAVQVCYIFISIVMEIVLIVLRY